MISESDIEPDEYWALPKAYFAALVRWLAVTGFDDDSDRFESTSPDGITVDVELVSAFAESLPVVYELVYELVAEVVLFKVSLEYKSELVVVVA